MSHKRLAVKNTIDSDDESEQLSSEKHSNEENTLGEDLYISQYTDKSFVVLGNTLNHSKALVSLGGSYNTGLRIGQGWVFAKFRQESVEKYIKTGEVVPYDYSKSDKFNYNQKQVIVKDDTDKIKLIFNELRNAFDLNNDYEGSSIIDVINQFEAKFK